MRKRYQMILAVLGAFAVIEVVKHAVFMRLSMDTYHLVSFVLDAGLASAALVLLYTAADKYASTLHRKNRVLTELNRQLLETEQLKDNLTAMIVHDLRNPLTGIQGGVDLLEMMELSPEPERAAKYLDMIRGSKDDLLHMIDGLLHVTKLESGELRPDLEAVEVSGLCERAVERLSLRAERAERALQIEPLSPDMAVVGDVELLDRLLDNLIGNALKYALGGSHVWLRCRPSGGSPGMLELAVADDGPGIPAEYRERIFDKFGTAAARKEGVQRSTGLGLAFCKLAVEAHGGQIRVEDNPGGGSAFVCTLPAAATVAEQPEGGHVNG